MSRCLSVLVGLALLAAGCSDSGGGDASSTTAAAPPVASFTLPADDLSADGTTPDEPAPELTASFRGVTETEIHLGIGIVDASVFGFDNGDQEAQWQAAIDAVNHKGGVLGRMIVPHYESYLPVGATEPEAACTRFVEDLAVFAFVGTARENNELCYTELGDTLVVNISPITDEVVARSNGLAFSTEPVGLDLELAAVDRMVAEGMVEGRRFHVRAFPAQESYIDPISERLVAGGGEVVGTSVQTTGTGDPLAAADEADRIVELASTQGADAIYGVVDQGLAAMGAVERAGNGMTVFTTLALATTYLTFGYDPGAIDMVALAPRPSAELHAAGDEGVVDCVERFESSSGETVNVGVADPEVDNFRLTVAACRGIDLFVAIAEAAGADLTNESFTAAAAALDSISLSGASSASLGPDKYGADDSEITVLRWDPSIKDFAST